MIPIEVRYLTNNDCYKQGRTIVPKGILVHSLGVPQPNPEVIIKQWDAPGVEKAVHFIISTDRIIQLLPDKSRCWGCGSGPNGSGNNTHIQFEICEPSGFKYSTGSTMVDYDEKKQQKYFDAVWTNAVDLAAYICKEYKLSPDTIICHSEAHTKGIASNHGDVMHWFPKHGKNMDDFRNAVQKAMTYIPTAPITRNSDTKAVKWLQERLNKAGIGYTVPVTGIYDSATRAAVFALVAKKKWNWEKSSGWQVGPGTIDTLAKL